MIHTLQKLKDFKFNSDLEIHQQLRSLKHVINIIVWIRDMRCYKTNPFRHKKRGKAHKKQGKNLEVRKAEML
jgi:hypothetical protein